MSAADVSGPVVCRAAILIADVHGYSRLMSRNEMATSVRMSQQIRLMRQLIGDYGGRVVNVAGDGVVALFDEPRKAVGFGVTIQQEFNNDTVWGPDEEPIVFRIGISIGEVFVEDDNVQGHSVNLAARIQSLAHPGGICITEDVHRAIGDSLKARSIGLQRLKNIAEPVDVFVLEFGGPGTPAGSPPPPVDQPALPAPDGAWLAVLPLANISGQPADHHLCDGVTRDIISNLSRFRDLAVIAPHSSFLFRDGQAPAEEVGRRLGVRYLFTGGLERLGSRMRTRVQLTETDHGRVLWSERLDTDIGEVFVFEDDITNLIAGRLAVQIEAAERRRVQALAPTALRAYGLTLRGHELCLQYGREANLHARRLFEQAAEVDSGFGRSYAGMSRTYNLAWRYRWADQPAACLTRALDLALEAVNRDAIDARGYGELGFTHLYQKHHDASLAAYGRAIDLNPNDADLLAEMGDALAYSEQPAEGIDLLERAMRLNPYYPDWYLWNLGDAYFFAGQYEKAVTALHKMRDQSQAHRLLASCYAHLGRIDAARAHAEQILVRQPNFSLELWRDVPPNRNPADNEIFIEGLRKAGLK